VFLPGWEEGLFPHQRNLDEKGRAGLEEERRLAYVGITRAKRRATISFAQNRQVRGLWQSGIPSRFLDELPAKHVDVVPMTTSYGGYGIGGYGQSQFDKAGSFSRESTYATPGWQRASERSARGETLKTAPRFIEGQSEIVGAEGLGFEVGNRVFHQKFGYGNVVAVDNNKLTVDFEKAGEKRVIDSFVERG
jgi:DNA helicase II / ATP-dependent DNA helicase PcrA